MIIPIKARKKKKSNEREQDCLETLEEITEVRKAGFHDAKYIS